MADLKSTIVNGKLRVTSDANVSGNLEGATISENGTQLSDKYLGKTSKAADADKLDGNDSSYFQKALPTTTTAGKVLKSTSTAGTVEWGDGATDHNQTVKGNGTAFGADAAVNIVGGGATSVTADTTNNKITISSTNTTYTFAEGSTDKAFTVTPSGGTAQTVAIHGLGDASLKGVATTVASGNSNLVTSGAVFTAIDNLPEPMVFKGTLGTGGTITTLPNASASNEGFTYKVITAGTYASQAAKVGDVFVSNGSAWVLIPAGDDVEDTWRNIKVNGTELLGSAISTGAVNFKNGSNVTITGSGNDITIAASQPTVNNGTLTIQKNGTNVQTFTANQSSNVTANITVPTKTSDLTNDSGFITSYNNQTVKGEGTAFGVNATVDIVAGSNVSITPDTTNNQITISSTDTNQTITAGGYNFGANSAVDIVAGPNVYVTPNASARKITIAAKDTTYSSKEAASGGTAVSLVTTGEKYTWNNKQNALPTTTTANKVLVSTTTSGTTKWSDFSSTGFLKTNTSGVVSVDTNSYLTTSGTAADSSKLNGQSASYYAKASDIPTVNNATLTIQKNGTTVNTFTANASSNVTANITVPTKTSDLTNDSGYITTYSTLAYCTTGASTAAKVADLNGFALTTGSRITLYLENSNTASNATLNVNNTGAKTINVGGPNVTNSTNLQKGLYNATYDGTYWVLYVIDNVKHWNADFKIAGANDGVYTIEGTNRKIYYNGSSLTYSLMVNGNGILTVKYDNSTSTYNWSYNDITNKRIIFGGTSSTSGTYDSFSYGAKYVSNSQYGNIVAAGAIGSDDDSRYITIGKDAECNSYYDDPDEGDMYGTDNIAIGTNAKVKTTDEYNIDGSTAIGYDAQCTRSDCVSLGNYSKASYLSSISIGYYAQGPSSEYSVRIGCGNQTSTGKKLMLGAGAVPYTYMNSAGSSWSSASDIRDKTDIHKIESALEFINSLTPITYVMNCREDYLYRDEKTRQPLLNEKGKQYYDEIEHEKGTKKKHRRFAGLSAQDTYQKMIDFYKDDNYAQIVDNNKYDNPDDEYLEQYSMAYERLIPFLIRAIQEQDEKINSLEKRIEELENKKESL